MGLFDRFKKVSAAPPAEVSAPPAGTGGGEATVEQLKGLVAAGYIDAKTFDQIETTMKNASAQLEQLHASGTISDEIYAQAMASMDASPGGANPGADLELLQNGESATASILALPEQAAVADGRATAKLEVHPATGSPYPVDCTIAAVPPNVDLRVGDFLRVKVDPRDPNRVTVDWTAFGLS
jgi:hypothetical protein